MAYLIYLLLFILALGVLIKSRLLPPHVGLSSNKLSHDDLLALLQHFNYRPEQGICFGFTITWAQEVALLQAEEFYERLNLIRREKGQILPKTDAITYKVKHKQPIKWQDYQLLEIKSFIEMICMAQSPDAYEDVYARRLTQVNINHIIAAAQQGCITQPVKRIFAKTVAFESLTHTTDFFNQLSLLIKKNDHLAMVVSNESHAVGLKKAANYWLFIDINYLYEQSTYYPYLVLDSAQLSSQLKDSFEESGNLIFNLDFISTENKSLRLRLEKLNSSYSLTYKHFFHKNSRDYSFIDICIQSGDEYSFEELIRLHNSSRRSYLTLEQIKGVLLSCVRRNQKAILIALMNAKGLDINTCVINQTTVLGLACKAGNTALVKLLLTHPFIKINHSNLKGNTPLMLACKYHKKDSELITLLLQAGACVTWQNDANKNALMIARENNNQLAVAAIKAYQREQHLAAETTRNVYLKLAKREGESDLSYAKKYNLFTKRATDTDAESQRSNQLFRY
ncbi:ankyrin repeat-containing protein [Legionella beliardensis]|uniref:Ankyrin repeat-containing protein n=1 Tax=Legionella beliardensis TaxID=91822 RepID=A0A378I1X8_9GAMM|nr:ankyrin repeat domain-containing protein [Legionella beliardensis]STX28952.1 ankyrin repeat-containing protein [Legionella beliardensis]